MPFNISIVAYREAHQRCQVLSGDAFSATRDEEVDALEALIGTPSECLGPVAPRASMTQPSANSARLALIVRSIEATILALASMRKRPYCGSTWED